MKNRDLEMGTEGGMDVFANLAALLILMTAVVTALARDHQLPPVVLATASESHIGATQDAEVTVTLKPGKEDGVSVFAEDEEIMGGIENLKDHLSATPAVTLVVRADKTVDWEHVANAMDIGTSLGLKVSAAVKP